MWVSMMAVGLLAVPSSDWLALLTGTTITTLLEAFTLQMDNLVLPLAGSTVLLLLRRRVRDWAAEMSNGLLPCQPQLEVNLWIPAQLIESSEKVRVFNKS
jgi:hypothetical protein